MRPSPSDPVAPAAREVVPLQQWDGFLGSRSLGAKIRSACETILERGSILVLDWGGIEVVSQSFADELVGKLVLMLGEEEFRRRIRFAGVSESVRPVLRYAIASRLDRVAEPTSQAM